MKKTILLWAVLLTIATSTFAHTTENINDRVINSFNKEFTQASDITWEISKDYVKVTFKMHDQFLFAYYNEAGKLLAVSRNITSSQLPLNLMADVKQQYGNYWISNLFEIAMNNDTSYYITLENSDQEIVLKSNGSSGWSVYKKDKKQ